MDKITNPFPIINVITFLYLIMQSCFDLIEIIVTLWQYIWQHRPRSTLAKLTACCMGGSVTVTKICHDDFIKWKHLLRYWPFVRGFHRPPVNSPHKGQWRGALMFSFICVWINAWVNNREAGDLRRYRAHYDVTLMLFQALLVTVTLSICFPIFTRWMPQPPPPPPPPSKKKEKKKMTIHHSLR